MSHVTAGTYRYIQVHKIALHCFNLMASSPLAMPINMQNDTLSQRINGVAATDGSAPASVASRSTPWRPLLASAQAPLRQQTERLPAQLLCVTTKS